MKLLARWLALVQQEQTVHQNGDDINDEAIENLFRFSPDDAHLSELSLAGLQDFMAQVCQHYAAVLSRSTDAAPMVLYGWHDAQVRQLRFSLVSSSHGRLPFSCRYRITNEVEPLLEQILLGDWHNPTWPQPVPGVPVLDELLVYCCDLGQGGR